MGILDEINKSEELLNNVRSDIEEVYYLNDLPWVIGYSGGKDSTSEWKNPYDEQYNTLEEINEKLREREKLEKKLQLLQSKGEASALQTVEYYEKIYKNLENLVEFRPSLIGGDNA